MLAVNPPPEPAPRRPPARSQPVLWLAAAAFLLALAVKCNTWFHKATERYYEAAIGGAPAIAEGPQNPGLGLNACEVFMYQSADAIGDLLHFLTLYLGFVLASLVLFTLLSAHWRKGALAALSAVFLLVALPHTCGLKLMEFGAILYLAFLLPLPRRPRALLALLTAVALLWKVGQETVRATTGLDFQAAIPGSGVLSYPFLFLMLALWFAVLHRVVRLAHEVFTGSVDVPRPLDFALYLLGLPILVGNGVAPGYAHFVAAWDREPDAGRGAVTLARCMAAALLLTIIARTAYYPTVRLFFPHCDVAFVLVWQIWARYGLSLVCDFLFLVTTQQTSVAVARLFGIALRDNYQAPLLAHDPADFWRRWSIYWREFLVTIAYLPTALALARWQGARRAWHVLPAVAVTFAATWAFNVLPVALLAPANPAMLPLSDVARSLGLYYGMQSAAVALTLLAQQIRLRPSAAWARALGIAATFTLMATLRGLTDPLWSFHEKLQLLGRALGILR